MEGERRRRQARGTAGPRHRPGQRRTAALPRTALPPARSTACIIISLFPPPARAPVLRLAHHDLTPIKDLHDLPPALLALLIAQGAASHDDLHSRRRTTGRWVSGARGRRSAPAAPSRYTPSRPPCCHPFGAPWELCEGEAEVGPCILGWEYCGGAPLAVIRSRIRAIRG